MNRAVLRADTVCGYKDTAANMPTFSEKDGQMDSQSRVLAVRVPDACRLTGLGRSKILELCYAGLIPSYTVGRARLFPVAGLEQWVEAQARTRGVPPEPGEE